MAAAVRRSESAQPGIERDRLVRRVHDGVDRFPVRLIARHPARTVLLQDDRQLQIRELLEQLHQILARRPARREQPRRRVRIACEYDVPRVDRRAAYRDRHGAAARRHRGHRRSGLRRDGGRGQRRLQHAQQAAVVLVGRERRRVVDRDRRQRAEDVADEICRRVERGRLADLPHRQRHELIEEGLDHGREAGRHQPFRNSGQPVGDAQRPVLRALRIEPCCRHYEPAEMEERLPVAGRVAGEPADAGWDPQQPLSGGALPDREAGRVRRAGEAERTHQLHVVGLRIRIVELRPCVYDIRLTAGTPRRPTTRCRR